MKTSDLLVKIVLQILFQHNTLRILWKNKMIIRSRCNFSNHDTCIEYFHNVQLCLIFQLKYYKCVILKLFCNLIICKEMGNDQLVFSVNQVKKMNIKLLDYFSSKLIITHLHIILKKICLHYNYNKYTLWFISYHSVMPLFLIVNYEESLWDNINFMRYLYEKWSMSKRKSYSNPRSTTILPMITQKMMCTID